MGTCGNCKHWNVTGFGLHDGSVTSTHKVTSIGECQLVARDWFPESADKMISLRGLEHTRFPVSGIIAVVTRRGFGCNQFIQNE